MTPNPRIRELVRNLTPKRAGWLRLPEDRPVDQAVKPALYLPIYEELLASLRKRPFVLLELGVWGGHSLEMWRNAFPRATIIGIDLKPLDRDMGPRVHVVEGSQADPELMQLVRERYAPEGFDVIIDDASHLGVTTAQSLQILYPQHLRSGGLYCIEDWGTGYLPDWPDGGPMAAPLNVRNLDAPTSSVGGGATHAAPMSSHEDGVVGLIKRLIDHTACQTVGLAQPSMVEEPLEIRSLCVWNGIVALWKPG